jgi:hypothetical protein
MADVNQADKHFKVPCVASVNRYYRSFANQTPAAKPTPTTLHQGRNAKPWRPGVKLEQARCFMLQCNMTTSLNIQLTLEDLLADLRFARRHDQLGRLALLAYCEVKGWA